MFAFCFEQEILREQDRIARKQAEEQAAATAEKNKSDEINNNSKETGLTCFAVEEINNLKNSNTFDEFLEK